MRTRTTLGSIGMPRAGQYLGKLEYDDWGIRIVYLGPPDESEPNRKLVDLAETAVRAFLDTEVKDHHSCLAGFCIVIRQGDGIDSLYLSLWDTDETGEMLEYGSVLNEDADDGFPEPESTNHKTPDEMILAGTEAAIWQTYYEKGDLAGYFAAPHVSAL
jgi:hypothetical protein